MQDYILEILLEHWPFVAVALIIGGLGEQFKGRLWTKERAAKSRFVWLMRLTLPLHPVAVGALAGTVPGLAIAEVVTYPARSVVYFAFAGLLSSWAYDTAQRLLARQDLLKELLSTKKEDPE